MSQRSPLAVVVWLALSHGATIALFLALAALFGVDASSYFAVILLPIGTMVFGLLGSLGAIPGARSAGYPPEALRNLLMISAGVALAVYLALLTALANMANPAHPGLLATFVKLETEGSVLLTRGSRELGSIGQVGSWGYVLLALKFAGAAFGALGVHNVLRLLPYCGNCRTFTRTREKGMLHFPSFEAWAAAMREVPDLPWQRARHMLQLPRRKAWSHAGKHYVAVRLRRHECPSCREQHMRERVFVHNGRAPIEQKQLSAAYSWFPSDGRSRPLPPAPADGPRGFGRKGV